MEDKRWLRLKVLGGAVLCYIALLLSEGYIFGGQDQIEILPLLKWCSDPSLYPTDFYIQSYLDKGFTERTIFVQVLQALGGANEWLFFILHVIFSLLLFWGLWRIAYRILGECHWALISTALAVLIGQQWSLGGNELYYGYLIPSIAAKALGSHGLAYFLDRGYIPSSLLFILALYLQPLVGIQLLFLGSVVFIWQSLKNGFQLSSTLKWFLPIALLAIPFVTKLVLLQDHGQLSTSQYLTILEFRLAHHFFPNYFPLHSYLMSGVLVLATFLYLRHQEKTIADWMIFTIVGCIIYSFVVIFYPIQLVINTQWFKSTIWIEFISIIGVILIIRNAFILYESIIIKALIAIGILFVGLKFYNPPTFSFPWNKSLQHSAEIDIALKAKSSTPKDAIFILPPDFTYFKHYSERSSYIDYKTMIHHHDVMEEWKKRIDQIYHCDLSDRRADKLEVCMIEGYRTTLLKSNEGLCQLAGFAVVPVDLESTYPEMVSNQKFKILKLCN